MICCDTYLITEMVSCTDGHLFCPECLRNYAKEIVYGQAQVNSVFGTFTAVDNQKICHSLKVLLTCLNVECKCGFTRG